MLGSMLVRELSKIHQVHALVHGAATYGLENSARIHTNIDISDETKIENLIKEIQPDFIINCVGVIKQIIKSADAQNIIAINSLLPHKLGNLAKKYNTKLIHFSTDCVFSGLKGPYRETDQPDILAADIYGASKLWGEVNDDMALTLRTSIIGPELKGKLSLFEWALGSKGKAIEGYKNVLYSGVTTLEMAKIISLLVEKFSTLSGLWHVSGPAISKYSLLEIINKTFQLNMIIKENNLIECDRRLDSLAFQNKTGYKPKSWEMMIRELKEYL